MNPKVIAWLKSLHACGEAVDWATEQQGTAQAWRDCERGDWMLWLLGKLSGESGGKKREKLVLACCKCARLSLKYVPKGEKRPLVAIQTAEKWVRGEATIKEVKTAAYAPSGPADAAAYAAYAAYVADAADAAAFAADAAAYAAAREKTLARCADIVRKHYPNPPRIGGKA